MLASAMRATPNDDPGTMTMHDLRIDGDRARASTTTTHRIGPPQTGRLELVRTDRDGWRVVLPRFFDD
jgi:hypothetical protein